LVRPSELTIEKRNFQEAKIFDEPIEGCSFRGVNVAIGFISRRTDKVEVSYDGYRA
jgi:hypothetical protein